MMKAVYKFSCISLLVFAGCQPTPDFDSIPRIEYVGIAQSTVTDEIGGRDEKVIVTISFEDQEGDLGATAAERGDKAFTNAYGETGNYELIHLSNQIETDFITVPGYDF